MSIGIELAALAVVFLVALRVGPLFVLAPVFGAVAIPARVRVFTRSRSRSCWRQPSRLRRLRSRSTPAR